MTSPAPHDETFTDNLGNSRAPAREGVDWRTDLNDWRFEEPAEISREHANDNSPNFLRRWIDRALGMGTPGKWMEDFAATLILCAGIALMFVFVVMFAP